MTIETRNELERLAQKLRAEGDEFFFVVQQNKKLLPESYRKEIGVVLPFVEYSANGEKNRGHYKSEVNIEVVEAVNGSRFSFSFEEEACDADD